MHNEDEFHGSAGDSGTMKEYSDPGGTYYPGGQGGNEDHPGMNKDTRIAKLGAELAGERERCLLIVKTRHPEMYELHSMIERGCGVVCSNQVCHCDEYALKSVRAERKRTQEIQELHDIRGGMSKQYGREIDDETF